MKKLSIILTIAGLGIAGVCFAAASSTTPYHFQITNGKLYQIIPAQQVLLSSSTLQAQINRIAYEISTLQSELILLQSLQTQLASSTISN